ncbi:GcrA family cell cycle regulator [Phenylobacterium deserti]|uniref:GcrA cell cycle regulator n=1 Tax=Phenylobacterium deserti TaxID=1914756 RepID=A0A328ABD9_9CAUL|nr:GcrA family cell cycle regulator [Phenylobacterium deserti]RAK52113.1 GcrA cell cycle regulator [Phenylobacterium deserti]
MSWTPERFDEMARLWANGWSASRIANELGGVTRNAVIGKLHRAGMKRAAPSKPAKPKAPRPSRAVAPRLVIAGRGAVVVVPPAGPPRKELLAHAWQPLKVSTPKVWTERQFGECCWPVGGEGAETLSCCAPVHKQGWCADHFRLGTNPQPKKKARSLERMALRAAA